MISNVTYSRKHSDATTLCSSVARAKAGRIWREAMGLSEAAAAAVSTFFGPVSLSRHHRSLALPLALVPSAIMGYLPLPRAAAA